VPDARKQDRPDRARAASSARSAAGGRRQPFFSSVALSLALACSGEQSQNWPDDAVWESAHFRYHTRAADAGVCQGVLDQLERHFQLTRDYLHFSWPAGRKVDYYKFSDVADFSANAACPPGSGACTRDNVIRSPDVLQHHELIHAYLAPLGLPPAFFTEGVAVALACGHAWTVGAKPWREVIALPFGDDRVFVEGPWFVGYLLHQYGPEAFLQLYGALDFRSASNEGIAATFQAVYPQALDEAWEAARASGPTVRCQFLWECSGAALPSDGTIEPIGRACDGGDQFRTITLDSERDVVVNRGGYLGYPAASCERATAVGSEDASPNNLIGHFSPGVYFVGRFDIPITVGARVAPAPALSTECSSSQPLSLSSVEFAHEHFEVAFPNDGSPWFLKLRSDRVRTLCGGSSQDIRVERCLGCDRLDSCGELDCATPLDAEEVITLRMTPLSGVGSFATSNFFWGF
jgi:hypothetical protein